jgi:hypothetical protein
MRRRDVLKATAGAVGSATFVGFAAGQESPDDLAVPKRVPRREYP